MKEKATIKDLFLERWLRKREHGDIIWTTKDGKEIPIKDMTDSHLENTIKLINNHRETEDLLVGCFDPLWDLD